MSADISAETEKLETISEGLAITVLGSNELDEESVSYLSEIKLEKFIYYALKSYEELDEVTHSWYLAGAKTETEFGGTEDFTEIYEGIASPETTDSLEFTDPRQTHETDSEAKRYADFFSREFDLEEAWYTQGETYLLDFYKDEAPKEYRDLYVAIQELRNYLNQIKRALENIISVQATQDGSLARYGQNNIITGPDNYEDVSRTVSRIHLELAKHENLKETVPYVRRFTDIMEDAILAISKMQVERIDDSVLQVFKTMRQKLFYKVWRLPAIIISIDTAAGPRKEELKIERAQNLETAKDELDEVIDNLEKQCADASLIPTKLDYPASSNNDETINDILKIYSDDI